MQLMDIAVSYDTKDEWNSADPRDAAIRSEPAR